MMNVEHESNNFKAESLKKSSSYLFTNPAPKHNRAQSSIVFSSSLVQKNKDQKICQKKTRPTLDLKYFSGKSEPVEEGTDGETYILDTCNQEASPTPKEAIYRFDESPTAGVETKEFFKAPDTTCMSPSNESLLFRSGANEEGGFFLRNSSTIFNNNTANSQNLKKNDETFVTQEIHESQLITPRDTDFLDVISEPTEYESHDNQPIKADQGFKNKRAGRVKNNYQELILEENELQPENSDMNRGNTNEQDKNENLSASGNLMVESQIINFNEPSSVPSSSEPSAEAIHQAEIEAKHAISQNIVFLFGIVLFSIVSLLVLEAQIPSTALIAVIYLYLLSLIIKDIAVSILRGGISYTAQRELLEAFNRLTIGAFILLVHLRYLHIISSSILCIIPLGISAYVNTCNLKARILVSAENRLMHIIYFFQASLILAKIDMILNMNWSNIFSVSWVTLVIMNCSFVKCLVLSVIALGKIMFKSVGSEDINFRAKSLWNFWRTCYYSLSIIAFVMLIRINRILDYSDAFDSLKKPILLGLGISISLILYTITVFRSLCRHVQKLYLPLMDYIFSQNNQTFEGSEEQQRVLKLQIEKKINYFVRLSSTYFRPSERTFPAQKYEPPQRKTRKNQNVKSGTSINSARVPNREKNRLIATNALKEEQKVLGRRLDIIELNGQSSPKKNKIQLKLHKEVINHTYMEMPLSYITRTEDQIKSEVSEGPIGRSLFEVKQAETSFRTSKASEEDNVCYLCCDQPSDIILSCGHGGICYECLVSMLKKKSECMECRSTIDFVYRVDVGSKSSKNVKAVEKIKICELTPDEIGTQYS